MVQLPGNLQGFVYAEDRDGDRSLGFKLLGPTNAPWSGEVEALARKLQACPYPETWKPAELFCSVLLEDGQRLVALACYGLRDHTSGQRPGGLELLGAIGPGMLDVNRARSIALWFRRRRAEVDDIRSLAGPLPMDSLPPAPAPTSSGFLALRLPSAGVLLITGATPDQPDQNLGLLDQPHANDWQWLPYCGPDFPFEQFGQRGPLIGWTPPHTDFAIILNRPKQDSAARGLARPSYRTLSAILILLIVMALNLYAWWSLPARLPAPRETPAVSIPTPGPQASAPTETRERFAIALHRLAANKTGGELTKDDQPLRQIYDRLVTTDPDLRCDAAKGQVLVGAVSQLAGLHPDRVARIIREEFAEKKGFDPEVIQIISDRVKQRLERELSSAK